MEKKLKISLDLDDKAFSSAVKRMQDQLSKIQTEPRLLQQQQQISQKMQSMGLGTLPGAPGDRQIEQAQQRAKQQTDKVFEETKRKLDIIKRLESDLNKEKMSGLATEERKLKIEERLADLKKQELRTTGELKVLTGPQGVGGAGGGMGAIPFKGIAQGLTALGTASMVISNIQSNLMRRQIETASATGSATQGTFGKELGSVYSGQQGLEMAFMPEKAKATKMAVESMKGAASRDWMKALGSIVLETVAGAAGGAMAGTALPVVGNIAGGIIGGLGGLGHALSNKDTYNTLSFSREATEAVNARRAKEFAENYNESYEGLKNQNPLKRMAAEEYNQNATRNLEFQRSLGLDYSSFHGPGGFREKAINSGFTDQMAMQMSGQIMSAGGSTRMGRESMLGLKAARGMDITNAGQILGNLSQTLGSSDSSKQAFIKMIAEGNKLGLDSSEYREENRKFLEATTQVISKSETGNQSDIESMVKRFGGFIAEPTNRGIQAAQTAYQAFNDITSSNTGPSGVMRAAGFLQDSVIGKMSATDRAALSAIPADQLAEDHPSVKALASKYHTSEKDIVSRVRKAGAGAIHRLPEGDRLTKSLISKRGDMEKTTSPMMKERLAKEIQEEQQSLSLTLLAEHPELGKSTKTLNSFIQGTTQATEAGRNKFFEQMADKKLEGGETGRVEDETIKGMAESSRLMLTTFREFKDQIVPTADAIGKFNDRLKQTVDIIMKMPESERSGLLQRLYSNLTGGNDKSSTQPQGGK